MLALLTLPVKRFVLITVLAGLGLGFSGCNWLGGIPTNAHLGDNGDTVVTLGSNPNEVDVTLHNFESRWLVDLGTSCQWNSSCMESEASQYVSTPVALTAIGDCGLQQSIGTICPYGDEYNAAIEMAWSGDGPNENCMGFHANFEGDFVLPTNPEIGGYNYPTSWYTIWPFNPYGYNGDGNGDCVD
jgi:hypothetical protein